MIKYYRAAKFALKERDLALEDRNLWKRRALDLEKELDERTRFFLEREYRLMDRFLTKTVGTFAITDEIRDKARINHITEAEVQEERLNEYLAEKREWYVDLARAEGLADPEREADRQIELNRSRLILEFQGQ